MSYTSGSLYTLPFDHWITPFWGASAFCDGGRSSGTLSATWFVSGLLGWSDLVDSSE